MIALVVCLNFLCDHLLLSLLSFFYIRSLFRVFYVDNFLFDILLRFFPSGSFFFFGGWDYVQADYL